MLKIASLGARHFARSSSLKKSPSVRCLVDLARRPLSEKSDVDHIPSRDMLVPPKSLRLHLRGAIEIEHNPIDSCIEH